MDSRGSILADAQPPKLCSHDSVRSTYQRYLPKPLPCDVFRRAIRGRMPRRRKSLRCGSES